MSINREAVFYLAVSPKSTFGLAAKLYTRPPRLAADEVAMAVTVSVPDALFRRPALEATIHVPADQVSRPVIDAAVVDNIKAELQRQLGVSLTVAVIEPQGDDHG